MKTNILMKCIIHKNIIYYYLFLFFIFVWLKYDLNMFMTDFMRFTLWAFLNQFKK